MTLDTALWHEAPQISCLQWSDPPGPAENTPMKPFFSFLLPFFLWGNFLTIYIFACISIPCRKHGLCYKKDERLVKRPASLIPPQRGRRVGGVGCTYVRGQGPPWWWLWEAGDLRTHQTTWGSAGGRLQVACRWEQMGQGWLSIQVAWVRAALSCGFEGRGYAKPPLLCLAKRHREQSNYD